MKKIHIPHWLKITLAVTLALIIPAGLITVGVLTVLAIFKFLLLIFYTLTI